MDGVINASMIKAGILQGIQIIAEEGLVGGWSILEEALSKTGTFDLTGVTSQTMAYISSYLLGNIDLETAIANGADINGDGRVDYLDQALAVLFFYESKFTDSSHKGGSSNIDSYRFPFSSTSTIPDNGKSND